MYICMTYIRIHTWRIVSYSAIVSEVLKHYNVKVACPVLDYPFKFNVPASDLYFSLSLRFRSVYFDFFNVCNNIS